MSPQWAPLSPHCDPIVSQWAPRGDFGGIVDPIWGNFGSFGPPFCRLFATSWSMFYCKAFLMHLRRDFGTKYIPKGWSESFPEEVFVVITLFCQHALFCLSPSKVLSETLPGRIFRSSWGRFWSTLNLFWCTVARFYLKVRFVHIFDGFWCPQGTPVGVPAAGANTFWRDGNLREFV